MYSLKKTKFKRFLILNCILLLFVFNINTNAQEIQGSKTQNIENSTNIVSFDRKIESQTWIIRGFLKYENALKYKNLLDLDEITYYNLHRKIVKNVINNYGTLDKSIFINEVSNSAENISFMTEFQKNSREIDISTVEEFNKSVKNLQGLIDFLLKQSSYKSYGLKQNNLSWPILGRVISEFGEQKRKKFNANVFEQGIRIKINFGENVEAVEEGFVRYADWLFGYGKLIIIDHGESFFTIYSYLSEVLIENNSLVHKGEIIGKVGDSGMTFGPCLYFEVRKNGEAQNPEDWLEKKKE